MSQIRMWMVVDRNGTPITDLMYSEANAQEEADELNKTGLREFAPYRVEGVTTRES